MARIITPATIDFETFGIKSRPDYPPRPVGVAIWEPGQRSKYMSWGHPTENNCNRGDAIKVLKRLYNKYPILGHNMKFDLDVGGEWLDLPYMPKHGYHDTEFLAFLDNPHAPKLALKALAEHYLDMPPDEQTALQDWIRAHVFISDKFANEDHKVFVGDRRPEGYQKITDSKLGAFIAYAPGKLVGKYAIGDVVRTRRLFDLLYKRVVIERGMGVAYQRELSLMPILLKNEREGVKLNQRKLRKDVKNWTSTIEIIDTWFRKKTKCKELNVDSGNELADALENAGFIGDWVLTDKGNRSVSKDNLPLAVTNKDILNVLAFRSKLVTMTNTFGKSWLRMADANDGMMHCNWSQVRNTDERGKSSAGARTGRLQSSPNFQNIPKKVKRMPLPKVLLNKMPIKVLPQMRAYIIPDSKEHVFGHRDYSQQELRILAHFEDDVLLEAYRENPRLDMHALATVLVNTLLNTDFDRRPIKDMGFGLLYGMGLGKLGEKMGVDRDVAKTLKAAYLDSFPGLKNLIKALADNAKAGEYLTTWGGRQYYCEEPAFSKKYGRLQTFEYKLINYLIQGSAADCTKEAIIRVDGACKHSRMLLSVHDEINMSIPKDCFYSEMKLMREAMESVELDVPMLSDGGMSPRGWQNVKVFTSAEIKKYGI